MPRGGSSPNGFLISSVRAPACIVKRLKSAIVSLRNANSVNVVLRRLSARESQNASKTQRAVFPEHIEAVRAGRSLIFTGGVGSGKTYAACSIAMELLDEMSVKFSSLSVINAAIFSDEAVLTRL